MSETKIKVVHITHDLDLGGLQRVIVNICRTIDRSRFDVSVLCLRNLGCFQPEIESLGIPVVLIPQKKGVDYFSFLKVAEYLRRSKPDVIHTHNTQPFVDGTIAALLSGVKKIVHTDHARSFPDRWRYMIAEWAVSFFAYRVVGVSEHTTKNLRKYEHIAVKKLLTIPNGIDPSPFEHSINKIEKRRELGLPEFGPILGVAVRLSTQKGVAFLLNALPEILQYYPTLSLVIAGDGPLKSDLQKQADVLGISSKVFFLGVRTDTSELLQLFDIYIMSSLWEGLPMILLEAMAAGCPVVSTDVGGIASAICHNENGLLIKPGNSEELKYAILKLLKNPQMRNSFSQNTIQRFTASFTARVMTQKYEQLYCSENKKRI